MCVIFGQRTAFVKLEALHLSPPIPVKVSVSHTYCVMCETIVTYFAPFLPKLSAASSDLFVRIQY